jgi:hypothetical protein
MTQYKATSRRKLTEDDLFKGGGTTVVSSGSSSQEPIPVGVEGHIIQDDVPVSFPQRTNLRFIGGLVEDNSAQDATIVTISGESIWEISPLDPNDIFYNTGRVGIGTNVPQTALQVGGTVYICSTQLQAMLSTESPTHPESYLT